MQKVKVIRDETGLAVDYQVEGDFPKYGNDDDRVDEIAVNIVKIIYEKTRKNIILTRIQELHYQF